MKWQWLSLIAASWGFAVGQQVAEHDALLPTGVPGLFSTASPTFPTPGGCPVAHFDQRVNRFTVEPTTSRIRARLELREIVQGGVPCSGPLVGKATDTFSFEAAHFVPSKDHWQGILDQAPERLINDHMGRSERSTLENSAMESTSDGSQESTIPLFEVCVVKTGVCVAQLGRPPLRSVFDTFGMFTLRERTPEINSLVSWMCAIFVIFLVLVLVQVMFVHFILASMFRASDDEDPVDKESETFVDKVVPSSYDVVMQVVVSLGRMAVAASTLIVVICCFVFKREVDTWKGTIMSCYPILIMSIHMIVVMNSTFKTLLYNSALRDKLHIVFRDSDQKKHVLTHPLWLTVFICTAIFLYTGLTTLISDAKTGSCAAAETSSSTEGCSNFQIFAYVGIGFWGLLFPVAYCVWLIFNDFAFENQFMPLYKIFSLDDDGKDAEAPGYLGKLTSVTYNEFTWAAHAVWNEAEERDPKAGVYAVEARTIRKKLKDLEATEDRPSKGEWSNFKDGTPQWMAASFSMWSWRVRMRHSTNKALELRLLLIVITAALAWTILAAIGASVYRQLCIPSLEEVTASIGQLSPEFNQHVFNYNIFVDTHIKSAGIEVIAEKKFTAYTAFHMPGLSDEPQTEPWIGKTKNVHVPFLVRNALMDSNASQAEELRASRRAPVPIELHVRGAGTTLVYRITVVKLETRVASLTYKYNTSRRVDEVVVHKNIDWEKVMPAEELAAEKDEFADDNEGAAVYVPADAKEVSIDMERELAIFGPTGGTVIKGFELAQFEAARKVVLCPPSGCKKQEKGGTSIDLKKAVTALPVELTPNGNDPLRFFVSIIRISNRLINLELEGAMGARASNGGKWAGMSFLPAFRPLVDQYETFFEVPESRRSQLTGADGGGNNTEEEWHTLFLRVMPQGNARSNWLEAELQPNRPGDEELEIFCRPQSPDDADAPLDPMVDAATKDLSCGASDQEVALAEDGEPTEELIIRSGELAFRNHFYVKYKYRLSNPKPFTLFMRVMFHDEIMDGVNSSTPMGLVPSHRTYTVRFLPQAPMRLEFFAKMPAMDSPSPAEAPNKALVSLSQGRHRKSLQESFREESLKPDAMPSPNDLSLPLFLSPPFSSEVVVYDAMVPVNAAGPLVIHMTGSHSLWVGSGDQPLEGLGRGSALRQEVSMRHGPNCGEDDMFSSAAPSPAIPASSSLCPVNLRIYERRDGFPRSYGIRLREAPPDVLLLLGFLSFAKGNAQPVPLPGFDPLASKINSTFLEFEWQWTQPSAAKESSSQGTSDATDRQQEAARARGAKEEAKEEADERQSESSSSDAGSSKTADDKKESPVNSESPSDTEVKKKDTEIAVESTPSPAQAEADAEDALSDVINPAARPKMIPRQREPEPTSAPRKMDEGLLLPFLLQTGSESSAGAPANHQDDVEDDDQPLFTAPGFLAEKHEAHRPASARMSPGEDEVEEPLFSSMFVAGAAPSAAPSPAAPVSAQVTTQTTTTSTTTPPPDPTEWKTGEPLPTGELVALAGSPLTKVNAQWNGMELPKSEREGAWFKVKLRGKALMESCWCDRKQLGNDCKERLRQQAPKAFTMYYRTNECSLRLFVNGKLQHEVQVGLAGAASPAVQERALEEAADASLLFHSTRKSDAARKAAAALPSKIEISPVASQPITAPL